MGGKQNLEVYVRDWYISSSESAVSYEEAQKALLFVDYTKIDERGARTGYGL